MFQNKMKIQVLSDLHLEFLSPSQVRRLVEKIVPVGDVLVLAGDIGDGTAPHYEEFLKEMANRFDKVFVVAGNHEYYGNEMETTQQKMGSVCGGLGNVSFLCSAWEDYGGFRWIGTTLWSCVEDGTTKCFTNDIRRIPNMSLSLYKECHEEDVRFLTCALEASRDKPCVVITHYLPSKKLIHEKYQNPMDEPYNQWFASSLDHLIGDHTEHIPLWIYGHTHEPRHTRLFQTEMVCNPVGYEGENRHPDWGFVVECHSAT